MKKIAALYNAKDKHGRDYLVSKYENNVVYYVFKNDFQDSNNAEYFLYVKRLFVKKNPGDRGKRPGRQPKSKIKTVY